MFRAFGFTGGLGNRSCRGWYYSSGATGRHPKNDVSRKPCPAKEWRSHDAKRWWDQGQIVCKPAQTPAIFLSVLERISFFLPPVSGERPALEFRCLAPQL